jgi:hypothetical protein
MQVWNENHWTGVVGAFHVQGSCWDRMRRRFVAQAGPINSLWAAVSPRDVATMAAVRARLHGAGHDVTENYAVLQNDTGDVDVIDADGDVRLLIQAGEADVLTISPVLRLAGVGAAGEVLVGVLGLSNMLNSGGSVVAVTRANGLGGALEVMIRGEGTFVMSCTTAPVSVDVDGVHLDAEEEHGWKYNGKTVAIDVGPSHLQKGVKHVIHIAFE